jgi:hypothetical protein
MFLVMCLSLQQHTVCLLLLIFLWSQAVAVAALTPQVVVVRVVCVQLSQRQVAVEV